jgi:hypothetical protein
MTGAALADGGRMRKALGAVSIAALVAGCASPSADDQANPFLQDMSDPGKEDSAYMNPDGTEVEVDLEGDVTGSSFQLREAPAILGQFVLTYFRKQEKLFIESLAEDSTNASRAEWLIDGQWVASDKVPDGATLKHWRLRGLNAVFLFSAGTKPKVGTELVAKAPAAPFSIFKDAGDTCADDDDHIPLDQSVYWYRWQPEQTRCKAALQDIKVTVTKTFSTSTAAVYPEYDQLTADGKLTAVVLFGQIDDGAITASETGMRNFARYSRWLTEAGFKSVAAPVGKRFEKKLSTGVVAQIDLYSPKEFSGLDDFAHFDNFQRALSEHRVTVVCDHLVL